MTQADLRFLMQRMSEATQAASAAAQAAALASTSHGPRPYGVGDMTKVLPTGPFSAIHERRRVCAMAPVELDVRTILILPGSQLQQ